MSDTRSGRGKMKLLLSTIIIVFSQANIVKTHSKLSSGNLCPKPCHCKTSSCGLEVTCCLDGRPLDRIPELPRTAYSVDLARCRIGKVSKGDFANMTMLDTLVLGDGRFAKLYKQDFYGLEKLKYLDLKSGQLEAVEPGTFSSLKRIRTIYFSNNQKLPLSAIPSILPGLVRSETLRNLYIDTINNARYSDDLTLRPEFLRGLEGHHLHILALRNNHIASASLKIFKFLQYIDCISLRKNFISEVVLSDFLVEQQYLQRLNTVYFDLRYQTPVSSHIGFQQFEEDCHEAISDAQLINCPRLSHEDIKQYVINITGTAIHLPGKLRRLNVGFIGLSGEFGNWVFYSNNITHLYAENNLEISLHGPLIGLTCLRYLTVADTPLRFWKVTSFLQYLPSLEVLNISGTSLQSQLSSGNLVLDNATNMEVLDVSRNGLTDFDLSRAAKMYPKLKTLLLQQNKLTMIPEIDSYSLETLDIRGNILKTLSNSDIKNIKSMIANSPGLRIFLSENPFDCQCSQTSFKFIEWIQDKSHWYHIADLDEVECALSSKQGSFATNVKAISLTDFEFECNKIAIVGSVCAVAASAVIILTVCVCYRKRWSILLTWLQIKLWCKSQSFSRRENINTDYSNIQPTGEVYVIFNNLPDSEERNFALSVLKDVIEACNLTPIYHDLTMPYFTPGFPYDMCIAKALEASQHCIVLLTPSLLTDVDSPHSMRAMRLVLTKGFSFVSTVVFRKPLQMSDVYLEYLGLLCGKRSQCTLEWLDGEDNQKYTCRKLRNRLRSS